MQIDDIRPDHFYRTRSGAICKVTSIQGDDDRTVAFIPYTDDKPGEPDEMPALFFTANVEEEVDLVDPQGKPMDDATPATPV